MKSLIFSIPLLFGIVFAFNGDVEETTSFYLEEAIEEQNLYEYYDALLVGIPSIQYMGGPGRSYSSGYATLGVYLAAFKPSTLSFPFFDLELHRLGNNTLSGNVGAGWRKISSDQNEMLGFNVYYDIRDARIGNFHQIGLGAEFLGPRWDYRINGYIPVGSKREKFDETFYAFQDDLFAVQSCYQAAMWGLDIEIGGRIFQTDFLNFYGAIGPYFYKSLCSNTLIGGMGRLCFNFSKFLTLEIFVTHDPVFNTHIQGQVTFSLRLPSLVNPFQSLFVPVRRNRIIVLEEVSLWDSNF